LQTVLIPKGLLHGMQCAIGSEAFNGSDFAAIGLDRQDRTGLDSEPIQMDGASATLGGIAADVGSSHAQFIAQEIDQ
jgi:hypothetical protein